MVELLHLFHIIKWITVSVLSDGTESVLSAVDKDQWDGRSETSEYNGEWHFLYSFLAPICEPEVFVWTISSSKKPNDGATVTNFVFQSTSYHLFQTIAYVEAPTKIVLNLVQFSCWK